MPDKPADAGGDTGQTIRAIRDLIRQQEHRYTVHAQSQMAVRRITNTEVAEALLNNASEVIEDYPDDKYSPSCLIYGVTASGRVLHIHSNHRAVIITVYEPDPEQWVNLKLRRSSR